MPRLREREKGVWGLFFTRGTQSVRCGRLETQCGHAMSVGGQISQKESRGAERLPAVPRPVRGYRLCHGSESGLLQLWPAAELTQL